jgi:hypothetical protein
MYQALPQGFDGYNGLISPDGENVAIGRGITSIINRKTFRVITLFNGESSRPMGWYSNTELIIQKYEDNCNVIKYNITNGDKININANQWINMAGAGKGHWVGGRPSDMVVVRDGRTLAKGLDWFCGGEGEWSVIISEQFVYVYNEFDLIHKLPLPAGVTRYFVNVRDGMCGFGRNGLRPQLLNCLTGIMTNESVCNFNESEPSFSAGQIATAIEHPSPYVAIRYAGKKECITLPVIEGCTGVDFKVIGDTGIVYSWSETGRGVLQDCDLTQERHLIGNTVPPVVIPPTTYLVDKRAPNPVGPRYEEPTTPDPVIARFNHFFHFGSFADAGHKYLNNDDWSRGKPWLVCPGNIAVVGSDAGSTCPKDVVAGADAIFTMAETPELWDKVKAIYIAAEMSTDPVASIIKLRDTCNLLMDNLGVSRKPFITYTTDKVYPELVREDTWIGLQYYIAQGDPLSKLDEFNSYYHSMLTNNENVAIIAQTYDRNGTYKEPLLPVIEKTIEIARSWGFQLQAWLNFSDGRGSVDNNYGGVRWYPELYPILRGILKAIPND